MYVHMKKKLQRKKYVKQGWCDHQSKSKNEKKGKKEKQIIAISEKQTQNYA